MNAKTGEEVQQDVRDWWRTSIIEMEPGVIRYRGYPIEELIGRVSFAQMIWLMTRGELPGVGQGNLLDAALMSAVDHGPQAPSIGIARMAATCGIGLNNAMASAVNVLGDVHGGAGEQAVQLHQNIAARMERGEDELAAVQNGLDDAIAIHGKFVSAPKSKPVSCRPATKLSSGSRLVWGSRFRNSFSPASTPCRQGDAASLAADWECTMSRRITTTKPWRRICPRSSFFPS